VIIWLLVSFPGENVDESWLAMAGRWLEPVGATMGLDWRLIVATVSAFVAKENSIAALGVIYGADDQGLGSLLQAAVTPASALSFLVVNMLFVPCVATVAAIRQETASWRWTLVSMGLMLGMALLVGFFVYQLAAAAGLAGA
jgi:ferrous iron transport protein B